MENKKILNEMSTDELVELILKEPYRIKEAFEATNDSSELYNALADKLYFLDRFRI